MILSGRGEGVLWTAAKATVETARAGFAAGVFMARQRGGLCVVMAKEPPSDSIRYLQHGATGPAAGPPHQQ